MYLYVYTQEELRETHTVGEKEVNKQRNLDRARIRDPANRKRLVSYVISTCTQLDDMCIDMLREGRGGGDIVV